MPAETVTKTNSEAAEAAASAKHAAKAAVAGAVDRGQKGLNEALDVAERTMRDAARRVEKAVREGVEALKEQADPYRDMAGERLEEAQKYVLERVKERPVTATLAGLGVGLLLGLLLANRSGK